MRTTESHVHAIFLGAGVRHSRRTRDRDEAGRRPCGKRTAIWIPAIWSALIIVFAGVAERSEAAENEVLKKLVDEGIAIGEVRVKLPAPTMSDGFSAEEQQKAIAGIATENQTVEDLTRNSIVAPFVLKIPDEKDTKRPASVRRVDAWFVAYGKFEKVVSAAFLPELITGLPKEQSPEKSAEARAKGEPFALVLNETALQARKIQLAPPQLSKELYVFAGTSIFERVRVCLTGRCVQTQSDNSTIVAGIVDSRFGGDAAYPNEWKPISRNDKDELQLGEARRYAGAGVYIKATRLAEPAGAILMEYHLAYDEPQDWFDGANLLRSKLPIIMQEVVRRFRRQAQSTLN